MKRRGFGRGCLDDNEKVYKGLEKYVILEVSKSVRVRIRENGAYTPFAFFLLS